MYRLRIFRRTDDTPEIIPLADNITVTDLRMLCAGYQAESPVFMFTIMKDDEMLFNLY